MREQKSLAVASDARKRKTTNCHVIEGSSMKNRTFQRCAAQVLLASVVATGAFGAWRQAFLFSPALSSSSKHAHGPGGHVHFFRRDASPGSRSERERGRFPSRGGYLRWVRYSSYIHQTNPKLTRTDAANIAGYVLEAAELNHLDAGLLAALFTVESEFKPETVSHCGAVGLGQLMPATARALCVRDVRDNHQNVNASAAYLHAQIVRFKGDIPTALAAYNAGGGAVRRYRGIPPYHETRWFVHHVLHVHRKICTGP